MAAAETIRFGPDDDPVARAATIAALGLQPALAPGDADALSTTAGSDPDGRVRAAALGALFRRGTTTRAARAWRDAIGDPDPGGFTRFLAAELVREKLFRLLGEELPYAATVMVEKFEMRGQLRHINIAIVVDKANHKSMVIGKGGEKLKQIGTQARHEMERLFDAKVYLDLHVHVQPGWRQNRAFLNALDWRTMTGEDDA